MPYQDMNGQWHEGYSPANEYPLGNGNYIPQAETVNSLQEHINAFTMAPDSASASRAGIPPVSLDPANLVNSLRPRLAPEEALKRAPTATEQIEHMIKSLLGTVGVAALAGFTGGLPLAIGAASVLHTHDADQSYIQNLPLAEEYIKAGYDPVAVRQWAETGDAKALQAEEKQRYEEANADRGYNLDVRKQGETEREANFRDKLDTRKANETERHDKASEGIEGFNAQTGRMNAIESNRHNLATELNAANASKLKDRLNLMPVETDDGHTVMVDPTVHGAGNNAFYQGVTPDGRMFTVPVGSTHSQGAGATRAAQGDYLQTLEELRNGNEDGLEGVAGFTGGIDSPVFGSSINSALNGTVSPYYEDVIHLRGLQTQQGIQAAKANGQSGINTTSEINAARQGVSQLDYRSVEDLRRTALKAEDKYLASNNLTLQPNGDITNADGAVIAHASPRNAAMINASNGNSPTTPDYSSKYNY